MVNAVKHGTQTTLNCLLVAVTDWSITTGIVFVSVLQGIEDASCSGLKNLLLGAISRCLLNTKDAVQVSVCLIMQCFLDSQHALLHLIAPLTEL